MVLPPSASSNEDSFGCLCFRDGNQPERSVHYSLVFRDDPQHFSVGREDVQCLLGTYDLSISKHHLDVHCIIYDVDDGRGVFVSPLCYVRNLSSNKTLLSRSDRADRDPITLETKGSEVLLSDHDVVHLSPGVSMEYLVTEPCREPDDSARSTRAVEVKRFRNFQVSSRLLGSGGNARVLLATKKDTGRQLACKVIHLPNHGVHVREHGVGGIPETNGMTGNHARSLFAKKRLKLFKEFELIKKHSHPNIISLEGVVCTTFNIYIFQELMTGGDLFSHLMRNGGTLTGPQMVPIIYQVLKALQYLHGENIVHRDLKPENILLTSWRDGARVVLSDFGHATVADGTRPSVNPTAPARMYTAVGTSGYVAPEIAFRECASRGYTKAVDIWSLGCINASCLLGECLFTNSIYATARIPSGTAMTVNALRLGVDDAMASPKWKNIGYLAKEFVRGCLKIHEEDRPTAEQCMQHRWLSHSAFGKDLEAEYQRAVAVSNWEPSPPFQDLVEVFETDMDVTDGSGDHAELGSHRSDVQNFTLESQRRTSNARISDANVTPGASRMDGDFMPDSLDMEPVNTYGFQRRTQHSSTRGKSTLIDRTQELSIFDLQPPLSEMSGPKAFTDPRLCLNGSWRPAIHRKPEEISCGTLGPLPRRRPGPLRKVAAANMDLPEALSIQAIGTETASNKRHLFDARTCLGLTQGNARRKKLKV